MNKKPDGSSQRMQTDVQKELQRLLAQTVDGCDHTMDTFQVAAILDVSYSAARKYVNGTRRIPLEKTLIVARFAASRIDRRLIEYIRRVYFSPGTADFDS